VADQADCWLTCAAGFTSQYEPSPGAGYCLRCFDISALLSVDENPVGSVIDKDFIWLIAIILATNDQTSFMHLDLT